MSSNDSIKKTLTVAFLLCIVCSVIVSTAAVVLKPAQEVNKTLDRKRNILSAAGMLDESRSVEEQFAQVSTRVVDLRTGRIHQSAAHIAWSDPSAPVAPADAEKLTFLGVVAVILQGGEGVLVVALAACRLSPMKLVRIVGSNAVLGCG